MFNMMLNLQSYVKIMILLVDSDCLRYDIYHRSRIRILRIFSFLKFNEFYDFLVEKNSQKISNFANQRCLARFDVLECNVHL